MGDLVFLVVTLALFMSGIWFVDGCDILRRQK